MNEDSSFIALLSSFLMWEFGKGVESSNELECITCLEFGIVEGLLRERGS